MRILFNASPAVRPVTGIGRYTKELISHLLQIDSQNQYTVFSIKSPLLNRRALFSCPKAKNVSWRPITLPYNYLNFIWNNLHLLPVEKIFGDHDILHSLDKVAPFTKSAKVIITIHDMGWYIFGNREEREGIIYKQIIETLRSSSAIITDSDFSKNEIIKYFPDAREKIYITRLGVSDKFHPIDKQSIPKEINKKYQWDDYILYIGILDQARKNVESIVAAYAGLKKKKKIKERLILCGRLSKHSGDLLRFIKKADLRDDIIVHSRWIPDDHIPYIYNKARLVLLPSLYEGFGLPVLEAMACGKPIIVSDIPPLREVAGDAAFFINPRSQTDLANSIEMLLSDNKLYNAMVEKGLSRSKYFTWIKTAQETLKIYESCAAR